MLLLHEERIKGGGRLPKGRKYLSGEIDFGILGKKTAYLFKNDKREKKNQPAFRLVIKEGDSWKEVGVFWVREVREKDDVEEEVVDFV